MVRSDVVSRGNTRTIGVPPDGRPWHDFMSRASTRAGRRWAPLVQLVLFVLFVLPPPVEDADAEEEEEEEEEEEVERFCCFPVDGAAGIHTRPPTVGFSWRCVSVRKEDTPPPPKVSSSHSPMSLVFVEEQGEDEEDAAEDEDEDEKAFAALAPRRPLAARKCDAMAAPEKRRVAWPERASLSLRVRVSSDPLGPFAPRHGLSVLSVQISVVAPHTTERDASLSARGTGRLAGSTWKSTPTRIP